MGTIHLLSLFCVGDEKIAQGNTIMCNINELPSIGSWRIVIPKLSDLVKETVGVGWGLAKAKVQIERASIILKTYSALWHWEIDVIIQTYRKQNGRNEEKNGGLRKGLKRES